LKAVENGGVGEKGYGIVMEVELTLVKHAHSGDTSRIPFKHQLRN
jgi:hypothetical protein